MREEDILAAVLKTAATLCAPGPPTTVSRPDTPYGQWLTALESTSKHAALVAIDRACADVARDLVALLHVGGASSEITEQFLRMRDKADGRLGDVQLNRDVSRSGRCCDQYCIAVSVLCVMSPLNMFIRTSSRLVCCACVLACVAAGVYGTLRVNCVSLVACVRACVRVLITYPIP